MLMKSTPIIVSAIGAAAGVIYLCPAAQQFCVFDREAALHGQWWRLITCHLVHFSHSHLLFDIIVFLLAGVLIESKSRRLFAALLATSAVAIGTALLLFAPHMQFYGGLSGIATTLLFFVALPYASQPNPRRVWGFVVCAAILLKLALEASGQAPLFARFDSPSVQVAPLSHAVGILVAIAIWRGVRSAVARHPIN
jgi:rhomboid family GlyGly-CTERM serine protease